MKAHLFARLCGSVSKSTLIGAIALCAVLTVIGIGRAGSRVVLAGRRPAANNSTQESAMTVRRERLTTETVSLRPQGFEPAAITRPAGRFILAVENYTGLDQIYVQLSRKRSSRLQEAPLSRGEYQWNELLDLPPGEYVLTEAAHPDWVCELTITSR